MSHSKRIGVGAVVAMLMGGCANFGHSEQASPLHDVHYYYVDMFAGYDQDLRITPDGQVIVAARTGNTRKDARQVTGQLTPEQCATLATAFQGWKKLKPAYSLDINSLVQIEYDGYQVQTSSIIRMPESFTNVKEYLDNIARTTLASAPQPATQPDATRPNMP
jgi:hypothetical protein